ncbi:MAG: hypothetical protein HZB29_09900 [Nitrospinae bacterium]|nr:hypothetical protein [Nitrospinota bacterium]
MAANKQSREELAAHLDAFGFSVPIGSVNKWFKSSRRDYFPSDKEMREVVRFALGEGTFDWEKELAEAVKADGDESDDRDYLRRLRRAQLIYAITKSNGGAAYV